jgi:hypothetical protein
MPWVLNGLIASYLVVEEHGTKQQQSVQQQQ